MQTTGWYFIGYAVPSILGFAVRYSQERRKIPKPDLFFQTICSIAASYVAFKLYAHIKDVGILTTKPLSEIDIDLFVASYFGAFFVTQFDKIVKRGWKGWWRDRAMDILAYTDKERKTK